MFPAQRLCERVHLCTAPAPRLLPSAPDSGVCCVQVLEDNGRGCMNTGQLIAALWYRLGIVSLLLSVKASQRTMSSLQTKSILNTHYPLNTFFFKTNAVPG